MSIRRSKARADLLAREVEAERRARRNHLARARDIFGRRLGSPVGLAICFGAGAVAGLGLGREPGSSMADGVAERNASGREAGFLERMSDTPLGNILIRLAAATLVRYVLIPSSVQADGADTSEEIPGGLAGS